MRAELCNFLLEIPVCCSASCWSHMFQRDTQPERSTQHFTLILGFTVGNSSAVYYRAGGMLVPLILRVRVCVFLCSSAWLTLHIVENVPTEMLK